MAEKFDIYNIFKHKPTSPEDVPSGPHFAIIIFESITQYTGYEDTHGSSGASIYPVYHSYTDESEWLAQINHMVKKNVERKYGTKKEFVAFKCGKPVEIRTEVVVSVEVVA